MAFTQVTGQVLDPNGFPYAGANLAARLVSTSTPRVGANVIDGYTSVKLDATGSFSMQLVDNATVTPAASTWTFQVDTDNSSVPAPLGTGPQSFVVSGVTITGAAQSVSAALQAVAPALARVISSGSGGGIAGGVIGPSTGHVSVIDPSIIGNVVLEVIGNNIAPLAIGNSAQPLAEISFWFFGAGSNSYILLTSDGVALSFIEFGTVGGTAALQFDVGSGGKIGFFNTTPVARQTPAGGTGGNAALISTLAALGITTGYGLLIETTVVAGQNLTANGAINPVAGNVVITKNGVAVCTLAAPTTPAQDYTVLRITSTTAQVHTITGPAAGFNAGGAGADLATFTSGAIGDGLTLMAFNAVWYILATRGTITLS